MVIYDFLDVYYKHQHLGANIMTYREFQHTDTYKILIGAGQLISSITSFLVSVLKHTSKALLWITQKAYFWIVKR